MKVPKEDEGGSWRQAFVVIVTLSVGLVSRQQHNSGVTENGGGRK